MKVYVFRGKGGVHGFTKDKGGGNLPAAHGAWMFFKEIGMKRGEEPRIAVNTDDALTDIERQGYHLVRITAVTRAKAP